MEETISEKEFIQIQLDAKNGNPEALSDLGYMYEEGIIVEQDYEKAKEYYEQAAKKGDAEAYYLLGELYYDGLGVKRNHEMSKYYHEIALKKGIKESLLSLGLIYVSGEIEIDYKKAIEFIEKSIEEDILTESCQRYLNCILYCYVPQKKVDYNEMFELALEENNDDEYLKKINKFLKNGANVIVYNSLKEITLEELNNMSNDTIINIRNIQFMDTNLCSDFYTVSDLKEILIKCNEILAGIDRNQKEEDIFMQIYLKLGEMIESDLETMENDDQNDSKLNNLMVLLEKKGLCRGFSILLKNLLDIVGIECIILSSKSDDENNAHAYNQVKINGKWYYCDLTWDSKYIIFFCLRSEEEYKKISLLETSYSTKEYPAEEDYPNIKLLAKKNYLKLLKNNIILNDSESQKQEERKKLLMLS